MPGSSPLHPQKVSRQVGRRHGRGRGRGDGRGGGRGRPRIHPVPHPSGPPKTPRPQMKFARKSLFMKKASSSKETRATKQKDSGPSDDTRAQKVAKSYTLQELGSIFEHKGLGLIMLEPGDDIVTTKSYTTEELFASPHLLLPFDIANRACGICGQMLKLARSVHNDMPDLGNELWDSFITPSVRRASSWATAGYFQPALAELLGLLLFMGRDNCWLSQQDVHKDWTAFCNLFDCLSATWMTLLSQDDSTLGINPKEGRAGGYRSELKSIIRGWRQRTNVFLEANFNILETPVKESRRRSMAKSSPGSF